MVDGNEVDHAWVHERVGAAVAGGLGAQEQALFDAHVNGCPGCFDAFMDAREADRGMQRVVGELAPSAGFEAELLETIREKTMRKRFGLAARRAGMAVAAAVALAATGVAADVVIHQEGGNNAVTRRLAEGAKEMSITNELEGLLGSLRGRHNYKNGATAENEQALETTAAIKAQFGWMPDRYDDAIGREGKTRPGVIAAGKEIRGIIQAEAVYDPVDNMRSELTAANKSLSGENARLHDELSRVLPENQRLIQQNAELARANNESSLPIQHRHERGQPQMQAELEKARSGSAGNGDQSVVSTAAPVDIPVMSVTDLVNGQTNVKPPSFNLDDVTKSGGTGGAGGTTINGGTLFMGADDPKLYFRVAGADEGNKKLAVPAYGIESRMAEANKFNQTQNYRAAADVYKEVLKQDPNNDQTKLLLQYTQDRINYRAYQRVTNERAGADNVEHVIPNTDLFAYSSDGVELKNQVADANRPAKTPISATTQPGAGARPAAPAEVSSEVAVRKVIRNGEVAFEVRSFDDAYQTIVAVVEEEKGYVSSTSSDKLANGKISGVVVVRVLPERLDRLLMKLRALGELKSQQIAANDVTKQYTDIESELKALRAMESRLIDLVKNGKGSVGDLVVAEKQLGEYRVRIEKLEGEIRYYNNLVGMATLTIKAYEKDIQKPTAAFEQENVTVGLETEDVEGKYKDARAVLQEAKGRIVESELKKYDAEQYSARIVADVPAEKADFVAAQLKQLGKAATFNRDRRQTTTGGTGVPTVQVEQKDARFTVTLYNLANVAPRETAVLTVAVRDVEGSFRKVLGLVRANLPAKDDKPTQVTGRVVTSSINGQQAEQMTADVRADVRAEQADGVLAAIREMGEVVTSTSSENPDTANVTAAKRGIQLRLVNAAAVSARETRTMRLVAAGVPEAYGKLLGALAEQGANVRVVGSQLNETDPQKVSASLSFEARREALPAVEKAFADAGVDYLSRSIVRSSDTANTLDSKVKFQIEELVTADSLAARRTTMLGIEVGNVEKGLEAVRGALPRDAKEVEYNVAKEASGRVTGHLVVDVPVGEAMGVLSKIGELGGVEKVNQVVKNAGVPETRYAKERIDLSLANPAGIVKGDEGFGATVKSALSAAVGALLYSVYLIVLGVVFVGPWLLVGWGGWRVLRRKTTT